MGQIVEVQMKRQSKEWRHYWPPRISKLHQNSNNLKDMVILVYDCNGVIQRIPFSDKRPSMRSVSVHFWNTTCDQLMKESSALSAEPLIILQEIARPHAAQGVADLIDRWGWEVLYQPPY